MGTPLNESSQTTGQDDAGAEVHWQSYLLLDDAPDSHHYKARTGGRLSKTYTNRIQYEREIFATSLPPNILVRAFDDRLDLLRCLIIGPSGTPFANAPFLFDLHLPPNSFPNHPPSVFYYSWSDDKPLSPNLYTDGTVCLSLLGTWEGQGTENWAADKSTVLQLLVSIQALIMVEKPYFTEPGYETSIGTPIAELESDAYSETTFALSRDVIRRACACPSRTFTRELAAFYLDGSAATGPPAIRAVLEEGRALVAESERHSAEGARPASGAARPPGTETRAQSEAAAGLKVLSAAGCGALRATVAQLEAVARARGRDW